MIGYLDCSTGVSGDKLLGAVLDAGARTGSFTADDLGALVRRLAPEARVHVERVTSHGISALSVRVGADGQPAFRAWRDLRAVLEGADLPVPVLRTATEAFRRLAEAEAEVHGGAVDDVHFHEVGALDSIVDIVGVCAGMRALGVDTLHASQPATGWGTVETSHGVLPVPAPATERMLEGVSTVPGHALPDGSEPGELTTPTGAALLATLVDAYGPPLAMSRRVSGYGAGTRDLGHPNVCRLTLGESPIGETATEPGTSHEEVVLLETNLDHLSGEALAFVAEELLADDVLDVWQTPVIMKKGRSAVVLSVLVSPGATDGIAERIHDLTGTLGVRRTSLTRTVRPRETISFDTPFGVVRAKVGAGLARPEHDDIARVARESGRPYAVVKDELTAMALAMVGPGHDGQTPGTTGSRG